MVDAERVPAIDGVLGLLDDADGAGGVRRKPAQPSSTPRDSRGSLTGFPMARERLVCDATTSGGLLVARGGRSCGGVPGAVIGRIVAGDPGTIVVQ